MRVLVLDDDPHILRAMALLLESETDVTTSDSVASALALVERERFDVVIADLRLPGR